MLSWLKRAALNQWTDMKAVKPEVRLVDGTFYLNSEAGLIRYRPRTTKDLTAFRDKYVNRFMLLTENYNRRGLFSLYSQIRGDVKRASYRANVRTRLRLATGVMLMLLVVMTGCANDGLADRVQQLELQVMQLESDLDATVEHSVAQALKDSTPNDQIAPDCD